MSAISEKFQSLREEVDRLFGRPGAVTIVGVTKFQSMEKVQDAIAGGLRDLGNNYAQEGEALMEAIGNGALNWHFIGHIQSRKAKFLTRYQCVQSLDRIEIAQALDRRMTEIATPLNVLVEINIGGEAQKSGIAPEALPAFLEFVKSSPHLRVRGLMAMPPPVENRAPYFKRLRKLFESHPTFDCLSMGTSEDYRVAVSEGATMIRLGTTLFGSRA